ncbi:MAG: hypothetical protein KGP28_02415 [Bdellovibrionales bacterium]|nr:hypothetical protein [Bdellovibrionales bacterium]
MSKWLLVFSFFAFSPAKASVVLNIEEAMANLLGHPAKVMNVHESRALGIDKERKTRFHPWSGSYWPDILGGIANHYRDHKKFGNQFLFALRYGVAKGRVRRDFRNVSENILNFNQSELDQKLSPSEKYDLLLGDLDFKFTRAILDDVDFRARHLKRSKMKDGSDHSDEDDFEGINNNFHYADVQSSYARFDNDVAYRYWKPRKDSLSYWFGICDGWSPAAIYLPRPVRAVTVTGALGHKITFFPDDLKALGSYLFARTNNDYMTTMNYQFAGRPCAERGEPNSDSVGFVRDFRCNDVDAGVWHLALLNRIGVDRVGLMMDIDNNKKINNHPMGSYELKYFNPATGKEGSMKESIAPRFTVVDGYAKRRNPKAVALLGVKSTVNFRYYQWPEESRDRVNDGPEYDKFQERTYVYDLELDEKGNILGGEWGDRSQETDLDSVAYTDQPDFIWMAPPGLLPYSEQSVFTSLGTPIDPNNPRPFGNMKWAWNGKEPLPDDWMLAARSDAMWREPIPGILVDIEGESSPQVMPVEARDSLMKSAQPLSNIVYYLFDQARTLEQK